MRAGIEKATDVTCLVTHQDDRLAANRRGVEVMWLRELTLVRKIYPRPLKDVLHLQFEEDRIGKDVPINSKHSLLW